MARAPRLDAPNALHHVAARGIEKRPIFLDAADAWSFVARLERSVREDDWTIYAWALVGNHFHLLVRTGERPLGRVMGSLLTGHAVAFNRRHGRAGHLFQNRFRSILCEDESYFLELVRYIHLNPLRAGFVRDLRELDRFPLAGHSALMGNAVRPWQATEPVLDRFGPSRKVAVAAYRAFVGMGIANGRRPDLISGRVLRRADGWTSGDAPARRGRENHASDERVLGRAPFVLDIERELANDAALARRDCTISVADLVARLAARADLEPEALLGDTRGRRACDLRAIAAYIWLESLGRSGSELARELNVGRATVYRGARRIRLALRREPAELEPGVERFASRSETIGSSVPKFVIRGLKA